MPVLQLRTNLSVSSPLILCDALRVLLVTHTGKPPGAMLVEVQGGLAMKLGEDDAPCALVDVRSIGATPQLAAALSGALADLLEQHLGLPADRLYIELRSPIGAHFGWNRGTFAHLDA